MNVTTNCVICKATVEVDVRVFNDHPTARCTDCVDFIDQFVADLTEEMSRDIPAVILGRLR